jgi:hypothetical protein
MTAQEKHAKRMFAKLKQIDDLTSDLDAETQELELEFRSVLDDKPESAGGKTPEP